MNFNRLNLPGLVLIEPMVFADERGFFMETYEDRRFAQAGIEKPFVQDNHSGSRRGILRGLHYQIRHAQGKLLRVVQGEIYDVAVDLRRSSPTFGQWEGVTLSAENRRMLWVPEGFAHGFYVLSEWAELVYKVTDYYAPDWERTLLWDDPELAITWPLVAGTPPLISAKDAQGCLLKDADVYD
jgi:dTDP-4-dehydrorhamnose 3,5-epimerase